MAWNGCMLLHSLKSHHVYYRIAIRNSLNTATDSSIFCRATFSISGILWKSVGHQIQLRTPRETLYTDLHRVRVALCPGCHVAGNTRQERWVKGRKQCVYIQLLTVSVLISILYIYPRARACAVSSSISVVQLNSGFVPSSKFKSTQSCPRESRRGHVRKLISSSQGFGSCTKACALPLSHWPNPLADRCHLTIPIECYRWESQIPIFVLVGTTFFSSRIIWCLMDPGGICLLSLFGCSYHGLWPAACSPTNTILES